MSDLRELYQEVIFDHYRKPRNYQALDCASHTAEGHNPLCGDRVTVYLNVADGVIEDLSFKGDGCAISTASASLMTEALKGKKLDEAQQVFDEFHHMLTDAETVGQPSLGKLDVLAGVREFPARVKCATLAWHTLQAALKNEQKTIATEDKMDVMTSLDSQTDAEALLESEEQLREDLITMLRTIYDPEIHVNIYDLGLIYKIDIDQQRNVSIDMTLTAPACPVAGTFPSIVEEQLSQVPDVNSVHVELVWEPPWSMDMLTDEVKLELGLL